MAIKAQVVLDRAAKTLLDETGDRWASTELLDYLNAGINAIANVKPDAVSVSEPFQLADESKQTIPDGGFQFIGVSRNLGSDGETLGRTVRLIPFTDLDSTDPDWPEKTGAEVLHVMHDSRTPRIFYVYPKPSSTPWNVELIYAKHPTRIDDPENDDLTVDDLYETPLYYWVIGHAYAKNTKRGDMAKSSAYFSLFNQFLGIKTQSQSATAPLAPEAAQRNATQIDKQG